MRAVVDDRDLAGLNGARPGRMSQVSWALGSSMAAIAGIFLAEELSALSVETLTLLIVDAFAAAIIGRLKNLPLTYVGGIVIGLALSFQENFLNWAGRWSTAATAIPTIILFLALLFLPQARIEGRRSFREITPHVPKLRSAALGMLALFAVVVVAGGLLDRPDGAPPRPRPRDRLHPHLPRAAHRLVGTDLARPDHVGARGRSPSPSGGRISACSVACWSPRCSSPFRSGC